MRSPLRRIFRERGVQYGIVRFFGHANDARGGGKQLHATAASAGAGNTIGLDREMPRFAGHAVVAMPDPVVEDDAVADPGAKGEHAEGVNAGCAGRAELEFSERSSIGVAFEEDGLADRLFDGGAKLEAVPAGEIGWVADDACRQFQRTGAADADPQQLAMSTKSRAQRNDGLLQVANDTLAALSKAGGKRDQLSDLIPGTICGDPEVCATEVDP